MVQTLFYVYNIVYAKRYTGSSQVHCLIKFTPRDVTIPNITGSLPNQVLLMISTSNHSINLFLKAIFY